MVMAHHHPIQKHKHKNKVKGKAPETCQMSMSCQCNQNVQKAMSCKIFSCPCVKEAKAHKPSFQNLQKHQTPQKHVQTSLLCLPPCFHKVTMLPHAATMPCTKQEQTNKRSARQRRARAQKAQRRPFITVLYRWCGIRWVRW